MLGSPIGSTRRCALRTHGHRFKKYRAKKPMPMNGPSASTSKNCRGRKSLMSSSSAAFMMIGLTTLSSSSLAICSVMSAALPVISSALPVISPAMPVAPWVGTCCEPAAPASPPAASPASANAASATEPPPFCKSAAPAWLVLKIPFTNASTLPERLDVTPAMAALSFGGRSSAQSTKAMVMGPAAAIICSIVQTIAANIQMYLLSTANGNHGIMI
mmetsp:Transcript_44764/g.124047  ORF Transcript_44764/g.124047 Transcript_44764/m.124047 type:complete len:216 (-) Transcript_44764:270-917(-)